MRKPYGFAFGILLAATVVFTTAQVSGFPSRPRFFSVGVGTSAAPTVQGAQTGQGNTNAGITWTIDNDSNGTANLARFNVISGDESMAIGATGSGRTSTTVTNGPTGAQAFWRTLGSAPLLLATSNTLAVTVEADQDVLFAQDVAVTGTLTVAGSPITASARVCKVKTADTARASNITPTADPDLANWVTTASTNYNLEAVLIVSAGSAIDFRISLESASATPAYAVGVINTMPTLSSASAVGYESFTILNENNADFQTEASGGMNIMRFNGNVNTGASGTDWDIEWSQVSSNASATTLRAGSYACLTPLASM